MIKVILFDLDDTLISEYDYIKSGYNMVSKYISDKYNLDSKQVFLDMLELFRKNKKNVFNRLLDLYSIKYDMDLIIELISIYRNHLPDISFYDDVLPTINFLRNQELKLGIISDGYLSTQKNKAEVLGLVNLFDKVILTDELGKDFWKPHPKAFEIMKDYFNVQYDEMMYIGDNPNKDFFIGSLHPIKTIQINREIGVYNGDIYYKGVLPDIVINSLLELDKILAIDLND